MNNKLEQLSDYVLEQLELSKDGKQSNVTLRRNLDYYTNFLKQNLSERYSINGVMAHPLNRFVACDLEGNVLEEHPNLSVGKTYYDRGKILKEHQAAQERVLFEDFKVYVPYEKTDDWIYSIAYKEVLHVYWKYEDSDEWQLSKGLIDIESLCKYGLTLTPNALKLYKP